jgi:hypothetical protein
MSSPNPSSSNYRHLDSKGSLSLTEEEFKAACSINIENLNRKSAHTFLVCVDGSDQSEIAFLSAMNFRKKYDHISVFHAFNG